MTLNDVKLNTDCIISHIELDDYSTKIRLMELGLTSGMKIKVVRKSVGKKTLLISFNASCFTIKDNLAKGVIVNYA